MPYKPMVKKLDLYGVVDVGATDPSSGVQGQLFYNTTDSLLKIYISGVWSTVGSGSTEPDGIYITMDGDYLVTPEGDYLAYN
jgi:hypothetical protein